MNIVFARVGPNQLSLASQLEGLHAPLCSVACDDRVAVGKSLTAAWVCKWFLGKGLVAHFPNDLTFRIEFDALVAVRKIDQRVAIIKLSRRYGAGKSLSKISSFGDLILVVGR